MAAGRSLGNHSSKGRPFRLALPRADYSDNSTESKRAQIKFFPPSLIPCLLGHHKDPSCKQPPKLRSAVPRIKLQGNSPSFLSKLEITKSHFGS